MTIREKILRHLALNPWRTATQVARSIGHSPSSVSSLMRRMRAGQVLGTTRFHTGPRGGRTYALWGTDVRVKRGLQA